MAQGLPAQADGLAMSWAEFLGQLHILVQFLARDGFFLPLTLLSRNGKEIFPIDSYPYEVQRQSRQVYSGHI